MGTDKRVGDRFARETSMKGERKKSRKGPLCEKLSGRWKGVVKWS